MWHDILAAFALVLVLEGILPFMSPARYREMLAAASRLQDRTLRTIGFASMIGGVVLLHVVR